MSASSPAYSLRASDWSEPSLLEAGGSASNLLNNADDGPRVIRKAALSAVGTSGCVFGRENGEGFDMERRL